MIAQWILSGLQALQDYVVYHVLTCLIPAFLLAGGMVSFVPKEAVLRYLGIATHRLCQLLRGSLLVHGNPSFGRRPLQGKVPAVPELVGMLASLVSQQN